jgi:hypothetical protein
MSRRPAPAPRFEVVTAIASASPRGVEHTEDRALLFHGSRLSGATGVIVCDGVGSRAGSGDRAAQVSLLARQHLGRRGVSGGLGSCAEDVAASLDGATDGEGATTFIAVGADEHGLVGFSFVGNGSLLEVQGLHLGTGRTRLLWVDHALPHVCIAGGREALRSYLPPDAGQTLEVTRGEFGLPAGSARPFLACSDGVATCEEQRIGRVNDGSVWKEVPRPLAGLLDGLEARWEDLVNVDADAEECRALLAEVLQEALDDALFADHLDDDAAVGGVFLRPAPTVRMAQRQQKRVS